MDNIGLILARSGSKGVKDKNIKLLNGKPLMAYSIEAALESGCFSEVLVSTDSEEYAEIARKYGAFVPWLRSAETSTDTASSYSATMEVLNRRRDERGRDFDTFCLLQPTSPLRTAEDLRGAYKLYEEKHAINVTSVCECDHLPTLAGNLNENHELHGFIPPGTETRRNFMPKFYRLNGAIYISDIAHYRVNADLFQKGGYAYIMERSHSVDIDSMEDFEYAEFLLSRREK